MGRQVWGCSLSNLREHAGHDQGHRGLEAETLAQTEDAVLELTLLLNAEIRVTEIILQALLFSCGVVSSDASGPEFTSPRQSRPGTSAGRRRAP
jgi:hypothetical protein